MSLAVQVVTLPMELDTGATVSIISDDGFSCLPLKTEKQMESVSTVSLFNISQIYFLPEDAERLRRATNSDPVLSKVLQYTQRGWPELCEEELKPYANRCHELTVKAGYLL